ncbi:hypothetical protein M514_00907 [Trichuris suis]|uniref:Uncharacterized protein n=1 Tax=Trichuris suis TaxID=68888 RepID=A0A085MLP8_9BILA|nr:hypothetical protein M513_00907 [Trichuris suis]KFD62392.1 hypothetical protein M514_00907 [Trichuris suis]
MEISTDRISVITLCNLYICCKWSHRSRTNLDLPLLVCCRLFIVFGSLPLFSRTPQKTSNKEAVLKFNMKTQKYPVCKIIIFNNEVYTADAVVIKLKVGTPKAGRQKVEKQNGRNVRRPKVGGPN